MRRADFDVHFAVTWRHPRRTAKAVTAEFSAPLKTLINSIVVVIAPPSHPLFASGQQGHQEFA